MVFIFIFIQFHIFSTRQGPQNRITHRKKKKHFIKQFFNTVLKKTRNPKIVSFFLNYWDPFPFSPSRDFFLYISSLPLKPINSGNKSRSDRTKRVISCLLNRFSGNQVYYLQFFPKTHSFSHKPIHVGKKIVEN